MPISSRARKREGSETRAQARRPRARSKPLAPTMWGEDIVQSDWKRSAVQQAFDGNWKVTPNGCWEWSGGKSHGYGQLRVYEVWGSDPVYAHRISYLLHKGPIPEDQNVCLKCDNHPCCNPSHLFLGDQAVNLRDMADKGRGPSGERNGNAKLTERDIKTIRALKAAGKTAIRDRQALWHLAGPSKHDTQRKEMGTRSWRDNNAPRQCEAHRRAGQRDARPVRGRAVVLEDRQAIWCHRRHGPRRNARQHVAHCFCCAA